MAQQLKKVTVKSLVGAYKLEINLFPDCKAFAVIAEQETNLVVAQDLDKAVDIRNFWQPPGGSEWVATKRGVRIPYGEESDPEAVSLLIAALFSGDNSVVLPKEGGNG